jgi:hypothetical protein
LRGRVKFDKLDLEQFLLDFGPEAAAGRGSASWMA